MHSVTFSRETITVAGLKTDLLFVTARLTDDTGVEDVPFDPAVEGHSPALRVGSRWVNLNLASGTAQDGVWSGGTTVTSGWTSGTYEPELLVARDAARNSLSVDPRTVADTPSVAVTTSNKPRLTLTFSPNPAIVNGALTRIVRVVDPSTGEPWQGVPIAIDFDSTCAEDPSRYPAGRTNAAGEFRSTLPAGNNFEFGHCTWISSDNVPRQPPTLISTTFQFPTYRWAVTARPASSSAPAGTNVAVTGMLSPSSPNNTELQLQRLYNNTWRTVNRGLTNQNSGFRILATPPGVATYSYRVLAPAENLRAAATSPVFTIRGVSH